MVSGLISSAGEAGALTAQGVTGHDSTLDMTDVMDISCDPPGPSSGRNISSTTSPCVSRVSSRPSSHVGEEIQAVTTRLHQVAVTPSGSARASPYIHRTPSLEDNRALTSSAEELCSTLGSGFRGAEPVESVWVPIDRPERKSSSCSPEYTKFDRPEAVPIRAPRQSSLSPRESKYSTSPVNKTLAVSGSEYKSTFRQSSSPPKERAISSREGRASAEKTVVLDRSVETAKRDSITRSKAETQRCATVTSNKASSVSPREFSSSVNTPTYQTRLERSPVASRSRDDVSRDVSESHSVGSLHRSGTRFTAKSVSPERFKAEDNLAQETHYPPLSKTLTPATQETEYRESSWGSSSKNKKVSSTTTSEDDLLLGIENKKDQKKKKKKLKATVQVEVDNPQPSMTVASLSESQDLLIGVSESHKQEPFIISEKSALDCTSLDVDFDADHFQTAKEYHEPAVESVEEFDEFHREDFQEAPETIPQTLEDFELHMEEEEKAMKVGEEVMLKSIHDDNDLARALEEAYSSDDNLPVKSKPQTRTHSRPRPSRHSEMFPFKEDSSDDEDRVKLRRRIVVSASVTSSASRSSVTEETSTDDRGETSGDDRGESSTDDRKTATSESDVGASPNPRGSSSSKNKKKKKKKR